LTKGVKITLAAVILVILGATSATFWIFRPSESEYVDIVQENNVIMTIDIANESDKVLRIDSPGGGWNDITIKDGDIYVSDSDCPDRTCIKTGKLRSESVPIVCLPHKLIIRFSDKNGE
jgi:hypothetical protein